MPQLIHLYPTREPPPRCPVIPAACLDTPRRHASWSYWNACQRAQRGNIMALHCLSDIAAARPSERLACAAGGTLVSLGHGYLVNGWGAAG